MKLFLLLFIITLSSFNIFGQLKKDLKDYTILTLPRNEQLIGKIRTNSTYTGQPVSEKYITTSTSLESYDSASSSNFKLSILNLLSTNLGIGSNKYKVEDLAGLQVSDCNDFGKLPLANNRTIVVSTVKASEITFTQVSGNSVDIKTDVQALLGKLFSTSNIGNLIGGTTEINNKSVKVTLKTGKDLVVATRTFKITSNNNFFFRNYGLNKAGVVGDNAFDFFEPDFDSRSQIEYQTSDNLSDFLSVDLVKHQGCFSLNYVNPAVSIVDGGLVGGRLLFCPKRNKVTGETKLLDSYNPKPEYQSTLPREFATVLTGDKIIKYLFQVRETNSVSYDGRPDNTNSSSNFSLEKADLKWELKKLVYKYSLVK